MSTQSKPADQYPVDQYIKAYDRYQNFASNHLIVGGILAMTSAVAATILFCALKTLKVHLGLNGHGAMAVSIGSGALATVIALSVLGIHYRNKSKEVKEAADQRRLITALADKKSTPQLGWTGDISLQKRLKAYTPSEWKDLFIALDQAEITPEQKMKAIEILCCTTAFILNFWPLKFEQNPSKTLKPETKALIQRRLDHLVPEVSVDYVCDLFSKLNQSYAHASTQQEKLALKMLVEYLKEKNPVGYFIAYFELGELGKYDKEFMAYNKSNLSTNVTTEGTKTLTLSRLQRIQLYRVLDARYFKKRNNLQVPILLLRNLVSERGEIQPHLLSELLTEIADSEHPFNPFNNDFIELMNRTATEAAEKFDKKHSNSG